MEEVGAAADGGASRANRGAILTSCVLVQDVLADRDGRIVAGTGDLGVWYNQWTEGVVTVGVGTAVLTARLGTRD